jgi:hypothetical protein
VALGTVRVEMGHKSVQMLTRVYERVLDVRSRREVVEYRRPDGRLPGEDLLRQILGERFDEIMGTGAAAADAACGRMRPEPRFCDNAVCHNRRTISPMVVTKKL